MIAAAALLLVLVVSGLLILKGRQGRAEKLPEMTLTVFLFGVKPEGFDEVVEEAEKRLQDSLNVSLNFEFTTPSDYKPTLKMELMAGRKIALAYDAPWMSNNELVSSGMYYDLQDYFNNDAYPGLKKAFSGELVEANKIDGHLYWIPVMGVEKDMVMLYIREDLREELGVEPVTDMATLEQYLVAVKEAYPDMVPMDLGRKGFYEFFNDDVLLRNRAGIFEPSGTGNMELYWEVAVSEDGKTCLGATTYGDPDQAFSNYPEGYRYNYYPERFRKFREWNAYLVENSITVTTPSGYDSQDTFINGDAAVCIGTLSRGSIEGELREKVPEGKVSFFPLYEKQRQMQEGAVFSAHIANNFLGVPVTAGEEQKERTMLFLDWLFRDEANYRLFRYGIEGRDYEVTEDGRFTVENAVNRYAFPYYEMVWNSQYELQNRNTPEILVKYQEYMDRESTYEDSPLTGFVYNSSRVKTELVAVNQEYSKIWFQLFHGTLDDVEQALDVYYQNARKVGLEKIREDLIRQVQDFLDRRGNGNKSE